MALELTIIACVVLLVGWIAAWMLSQKPVTGTQQLIQAHRYSDAAEDARKQIASRPDDAALRLHLAEALKLMGRFGESQASYEDALRLDPFDAAAREGVALSLAYEGKDLERARRSMEETIATRPEILEFQALALAYILLREGSRDAALRLFDDNSVLLQTRFHDDYTDPDPLLAETLFLYATLSEAAGHHDQAVALLEQAASWAPGSVWARSNAADLATPVP